VANPLILQIIHRYKYNRAVCFEPFLADLLCRQAVQSLQQEKWDFIVPVPLHPAKEREREFNQASNLARHLSRATNIPVNEKLLRRVRPTATQTQLNRAERAANVSTAFALRENVKLNGAKIVLLDDVLTTGATTSACAQMLRNAGAGDLCVWTVARGT
jgi:ComF family protein